MSIIANLISKINNENILSTKKNFITPLTKNSIELCKSLYKEGAIESFSVGSGSLEITLNKKLEKRKIVKKVFHKKLKVNLTFKEIIKLKNGFSSFIITSDYGMSNHQRLKEIKKGGIVKYKVL